MKRKRKITLGILGASAIAMLCPITTSVSGHTKFTLFGEGNMPISGAKVAQTWGVYGWGGFPGHASSTTDTNGSVRFPPRKTIGLLGARLFNRATAFVKQCTSWLIFGKFGSKYTERWGPIVGLNVELPVGTWLPADWVPGTRLEDLVLPIMGNGSHRYVYIRNLNPNAPNAFVGGDALGFVGDVEVVLRLRHATTEEIQIIRRHQVARLEVEKTK